VGIREDTVSVDEGDETFRFVAAGRMQHGMRFVAALGGGGSC
jgi:hypothetical protein